MGGLGRNAMADGDRKMIRVVGFFFGVVIGISLLAAVVDAPTRERAAVLVEDLSRLVFATTNRRATETKIHTPRSIAAPEPAQSSGVRLAEARSVEAKELRTDAVGQSDETLNNAPIESIQRTTSPVDSAVAPETRLEQQGGSNPKNSIATNDVSNRAPEFQEWQPVWQAFRSELSAKGFAGQLQRLTGLEYRVRRASPWNYQVEFAFADAGQRDTVLRDIETKTGLGLMEIQP